MRRYSNLRIAVAILLFVNFISLLAVTSSPGSTVGSAIARLLPLFSQSSEHISITTHSYAYVAASQHQGRIFKEPLSSTTFFQYCQELSQKDGSHPVTLYLDVHGKRTRRGFWAPTQVVHEAHISLRSVDPDRLSEEELMTFQSAAELQLASHVKETEPTWWAEFGEGLSSGSTNRVRWLGISHNLFALIALVLFVPTTWRMLNTRRLARWWQKILVEKRCPRCKYSLVELVAATCPECGTNLDVPRFVELKKP